MNFLKKFFKISKTPKFANAETLAITGVESLHFLSKNYFQKLLNCEVFEVAEAPHLLNMEWTGQEFLTREEAVSIMQIQGCRKEHYESY